MARAIWSGAISFGLVNVPVKLYTRDLAQDGPLPPALQQDRRADPAEARRSDDRRGGPLRGHRQGLRDHARPLRGDHHEELDALDPKATKTIDIEEFVDLAEIDPIYYDHTYYLAPTAGGAKAYRLLLDAMREAGKVGIGRVVLRSKQQLCALRPTGDVLTLTTMLWGDEVLSPDRLDELEAVEEAEATDRELKMAEQLIDVAVGRRSSRPSSTTSTASGCST